MSIVAFADASGVRDDASCYGIGVVSVKAAGLERFNALFHELRARHGVPAEVSWEALGDRAGDINFLLEWLEQLVVHGVGSVDVMVVNTRMYKLWSKPDADRRRAFNVSCTQLLRSIAHRERCGIDLFLKNRPGASLHQPAAMEVIGNHMLRQISSPGELQSISEVAAEETPGVQVADLLTGLVFAAHALRMDPKMRLGAGQWLALERAPWIVGWNHLHHDTWPHERFNIWHFPLEFRGKLGGTVNVQPRPLQRLVLQEDVEARRRMP